MKLNRFADQTKANAASAIATAPDASSPRTASGRNMNAATASAASAWTASRSTGRTPRQSSASETAVTAPHATSQMGPPGIGTVESTATGRNPAQIASPPTRRTGRSCSDRSDRSIERQMAPRPNSSSAERQRAERRCREHRDPWRVRQCTHSGAPPNPAFRGRGPQTIGSCRQIVQTRKTRQNRLLRAGQRAAMPDKAKFSKADHEFSGPFSSLTRPADSHGAEAANGLACRVLATAASYLSPRPDFTLPRGRPVWHNELQLLDIAEKVPTASPKDGFLANFIR